MQKIMFTSLIALMTMSCGLRKENAQNETTQINQEQISTDEKTNTDMDTPGREIDNPSYESSIAKWNRIKKEHNNSYAYTIVYSSYSGYSNRTVITVNNGAVVQRAFYEINPNQVPNPEVGDKPKFVENKSNLNTNKEGSPAVTIDKLYEDCSEKYLTVDKKANTITFEVDKVGILKVCGYTPNNCMDDCFTGVTIGEIKWIE